MQDQYFKMFGQLTTDKNNPTVQYKTIDINVWEDDQGNRVPADQWLEDRIKIGPKGNDA